MFEEKQPQRVPPRETRMLDIAVILISRWKAIVSMTVGTALLAAVIALLLPKAYTARTVLMPAPQQSGTSAAELMMDQLPAGVGALAGGHDRNAELIGVILKSRSLTDSIVHWVDPDSTRTADLHEILNRHTTIDTGPEGGITVEVTADGPQLAAKIAGSFNEAVNVIAADITRDAARRRLEFLEKQLARARDDLAASEQKALEFQEQSNTPDMQAQATQTIQAASDLKEEILRQELRVSALRRTVTRNNPELQAAEAELTTLNEQLQRLVSGSRVGNQVFLSLAESPELKLKASRLARDLTKDQQVYTSLLASFTQAQLDVQDELPITSVLDPPQVPRAPSGPRVGVIASLAAVLGLVFGIMAALSSDWIRRLREDPENERLLDAWEGMRVDLARITPGRRNGRRGSSERALS